MARHFQWSCAAVAAVIFFVHRIAAAASLDTALLTLELDSLGEHGPAQVCVVADYMTDPGASRAQFKDLPRLTLATGTSTPKVPSACDGRIEMPNPSPVRDVRYQCVSSVGKGTALLYLQGAEIEGPPNLSQNVLRLTLRRAGTSSARPYVQFLGGDFLPQGPVTLHLADNTQFIRVDLRPRCLSRVVTVPLHTGVPSDCSGKGVWSGVAGAEEVHPVQILDVENTSEEHGVVAVTSCEHTFQATWEGRVPPRELRLVATDFKFQWKTNCLSGPRCPSVGGGVSCDQPKDADTCIYTCKGETHFPATVQFSFAAPGGSLERSWTDTLDRPGELLESYIPEEQRRIALLWNWKEQEKANRDERAKRVDDEIDYVELRTPEGAVHRIAPDANQIRIPELDCDDSISYRYVGSRLFSEVPARVCPQGRVVLDDPSAHRRDRFGVAGALGAAARYIAGGGDTAWGPAGDAHVVLVFRHLRDYLNWNGAALDFEVRGGAIFMGQPYCSHVVTGASTACTGSDWERVPYWLVPMTLGANLSFWKMTVGASAGLAFSTYHQERDTEKVARPTLFASRFHVGYHLSRAITVELQVRYFAREDVRVRLYDAFGALQEKRAPDSGAAWMPGAVLRFEDLF